VIWSILIRIRNYYFLLKLRVQRKLDVRTSGVSSRIPGTTLHVVLLDYDRINDARLKEELAFLQDEFEIGNFYVLETRENGRHAVCIDALTLRDVKDIVDFSNCDLAFKRGPRLNEYCSWVLRFAKKGGRDAPKYLYTVMSPYEGKNLQSLSHATYLLNFDIKIKVKNPYGPKAIEVHDYNTGQRTNKE
jgi:hypothetical protein